jgi:formylglycine-generating enzyme required for sulfatase activity
MGMVFVPAGEFFMGSNPGDGASEGYTPYENEYPRHSVSLEAFWIDRAEVTNAQYRQCVEAKHCSDPKESASETRQSYYGDPKFDEYPVVNVTWYQAVAYCTWARARLPKEAEWAYAARGPESRFYPWGDTFDGLRLNYCDKKCQYGYADQTNDGFEDTAPVGNYPAGASWVGAVDMLGNVWEWVWDWHSLYPGHEWLEHPNSYPEQTYRLIRGGSWDTSRGHARNAFRNWYLPDEYSSSIGFRCAADPQP